MSHIHKNIKHLRESRGQSKTWLAKQVGKVSQSISDYESGKSTPPIHVVEQLSEIFKVPVGRLISADLSNQGALELSVANDPAAPYGQDVKRITKEKELLHEALETKEEALSKVIEEIAAIEKKLAGDEYVRTRHADLIRLLRALRKNYQ